MTPEQAWKMMQAAAPLRAEVRKAFPCLECDGVGEHYPGHHWDPCLECAGPGIQIPDEENDD